MVDGPEAGVFRSGEKKDSKSNCGYKLTPCVLLEITFSGDLQTAQLLLGNVLKNCYHSFLLAHLMQTKSLVVYLYINSVIYPRFPLDHPTNQPSKTLGRDSTQSTDNKIPEWDPALESPF